MFACIPSEVGAEAPLCTEDVSYVCKNQFGFDYGDLDQD